MLDLDADIPFGGVYLINDPASLNEFGNRAARYGQAAPAVRHNPTLKGADELGGPDDHPKPRFRGSLGCNMCRTYVYLSLSSYFTGRGLISALPVCLIVDLFLLGKLKVQ